MLPVLPAASEEAIFDLTSLRGRAVLEARGAQVTSTYRQTRLGVYLVVKMALAGAAGVGGNAERHTDKQASYLRRGVCGVRLLLLTPERGRERIPFFSEAAMCTCANPLIVFMLPPASPAPAPAPAPSPTTSPAPAPSRLSTAWALPGGGEEIPRGGSERGCEDEVSGAF